MGKHSHSPGRKSSFHLIVCEDLGKLEGVLRQRDVVGIGVPLVHAAVGMAIPELSEDRQYLLYGRDEERRALLNEE